MIEVVHEGIYNTVQDAGRLGSAQMGVPVSGYADAYAGALANALLNNSNTEAVIEITYGQGAFQFKEDTLFCLTGGNFSPRLDDAPLEMNRVYEAPAHSTLRFGKRQFGARTYLAVAGGIQWEQVLGSRSFTPGITPLRLEKGDLLPTLSAPPFHAQQYARVRTPQEHFTSQELLCYPGPEYNQLTPAQQQRLSEPFTLSVDNNRVGYRLEEVLENQLDAILTAAVLPGTVQLTPSGKIIVLLPDCQVTGGYPRILQLAPEALSRLSQKMAGAPMQFRVLSIPAPQT